MHVSAKQDCNKQSLAAYKGLSGGIDEVHCAYGPLVPVPSSGATLCPLERDQILSPPSSSLLSSLYLMPRSAGISLLCTLESLSLNELHDA